MFDGAERNGTFKHESLSVIGYHKEGMVRQGMSLAAGILDKSQPVFGHETGDLLAGRTSEKNETVYSSNSCL